MADAVISIWNAKNMYNTWRPITAIRNANIDGNDATPADAAWTPVLPTPPFQEYPSGHSGASGAAAAQLSSFYGNNTPFSVTSDGLPGITRIYASFSDAVADVALARIAGGIHFRFACDVAAQMGAAIAAQATTTRMTRLHGKDNGD